MQDASTEKMHDVCTYLSWALESEIPLKFPLSKAQRNICSIADQKKLYLNLDAAYEQTLLPSFELLKILSNLAKVQTGDIKLTDLKMELPEDPKLFIFAAH